MKRLAVIISASGGYDRKTSSLAGIKQDAVNWKNFFSTNVGGAWEPNELEVVHDPTPEDMERIRLLTYIDDYYFVVLTFSGHGGYDNATKTNGYYINNKIIPESDFLLQVDKQLLIFDACRVLEKNLFKLKCFSEKKAPILSNSSALRNIREMSRQMYNDTIMKLPPMEERIYSCSKGETAGDSGDGGLFTLNFIHAVKTISRTQHGIITTSEAFEIAKNETINVRRKQIPSAILSRSPFPIGVVPPTRLPNKSHRRLNV